eukprot:CAMPEP_0115161780 /NCGR_PEP_ID=MMETSP0227-20121206/71592_1 /TAXON_ID=89957 /ORGANISM="Polarella glacialis, Strain CCMP 1383" /LENGTH=320 /DNA_ID=CAMNT_0002573909 /DNA_START=60 /DNA_END=1022 /DNA_ORIENTATION=-
MKVAPQALWHCILLAALNSVIATAATYRAAVVEFAPLQAESNASGDEILALQLQNLAALGSFARQAKANGSQIIVFPEYGISGDGFTGSDFNRTSLQPFLDELPASGSSNPCLERLSAAPVISAASCLARELQLVIVLNLATRQPCRQDGDGAHCPEDGIYIHNTAIALGEDGKLLAVYHKRHLFGDELGFMDPSVSTSPVTFTTSFGVTFGLLICFDLIFDVFPDTSVVDYAFPTDWVNDIRLGPLPGPSAHFAQQTWSWMHGRNLLAANYGGFGQKASGSGIWQSGQELASFFNPSNGPQSRLLIADVNTSMISGFLI